MRYTIAVVIAVAITALAGGPLWAQCRAEAITIQARVTPIAIGAGPCGESCVMPTLTTCDGQVFSVVPDAVGRQLACPAMACSNVQVCGFLLPNSKLIEASCFRTIPALEPVAPYNPWFNY